MLVMGRGHKNTYIGAYHENHVDMVGEKYCLHSHEGGGGGAPT